MGVAAHGAGRAAQTRSCDASAVAFSAVVVVVVVAVAVTRASAAVLVHRAFPCPGTGRAPRWNARRRGACVRAGRGGLRVAVAAAGSTGSRRLPSGGSPPWCCLRGASRCARKDDAARCRGAGVTAFDLGVRPCPVQQGPGQRSGVRAPSRSGLRFPVRASKRHAADMPSRSSHGGSGGPCHRALRPRARVVKSAAGILRYDLPVVSKTAGIRARRTGRILPAAAALSAGRPVPRRGASAEAGGTVGAPAARARADQTPGRVARPGPLMHARGGGCGQSCAANTGRVRLSASPSVHSTSSSMRMPP